MAAILATIAIKAQRHNNCLRKFAYNKIGRLRSKDTQHNTQRVPFFSTAAAALTPTQPPTRSSLSMKRCSWQLVYLGTRGGFYFLHDRLLITMLPLAVCTHVSLFVFLSSVCLSTLHLSVPLSHCLVSGVNVAMGSQYHPIFNCFPINYHTVVRADILNCKSPGAK